MELKAKDMSDSKKYKKWSKEVSNDDMTKRICVEECENGYIITINKYGYKGEGEDREYYDETEKYISKENPMESKDEKDDNSTSKAISGYMDSMDGMGMFNI